jgi:benzoylformate decarboxylase
MSGKRAFLELLKQEGVEVLFGNPGTTELPLMDAFATENELRYVLGLQEAGVMAMADGYAQATGKLTVANFHVAPGLGNAMGMLYDAQKAASPILVTAGQQDQEFIVTEPILSADLPRLARPFVKWADEVRRRRGPAADGASRRQDRAGAADRTGVPVAARRHPQVGRRARPDGADARGAASARRLAAVEAAADVLAAAKRPVIIAAMWWRRAAPMPSWWRSPS